MERDPLGDILRQTDAARPPPAVDDARIIACARRKSAQRRGRRTAAVVAAAIILAAVVDHLPRRLAPAPAVVVTPPQEPSIEVEQATVDQLLAAEHRNAIFARLSQLRRSGDPVARLSQQREQVATRLLEDIAITPDPERQEALYRQVATLFPDTGAATVARQRLATLQ
jgi:hypothetical protein